MNNVPAVWNQFLIDCLLWKDLKNGTKELIYVLAEIFSDSFLLHSYIDDWIFFDSDLFRALGRNLGVHAQPSTIDDEQVVIYSLKVVDRSVSDFSLKGLSQLVTREVGNVKVGEAATQFFRQRSCSTTKFKDWSDQREGVKILIGGVFVDNQFHFFISIAL